MISLELKNKIIPHLKQRINKETYIYINWMFDECYFTQEKGVPLITLRPPLNSNIGGFQFDTRTGAFYGVARWTTIQKTGKKV